MDLKSKLEQFLFSTRPGAWGKPSRYGTRAASESKHDLPNSTTEPRRGDPWKSQQRIRLEPHASAIFQIHSRSTHPREPRGSSQKRFESRILARPTIDKLPPYKRYTCNGEACTRLSVCRAVPSGCDCLAVRLQGAGLEVKYVRLHVIRPS